MSLLGLVRHLAEVERKWFRHGFAGQDVPNRYQSEDDPDGDFNGAVADGAVVAEAWAAWEEEVGFAEQFATDTDLNFVGRDGADQPISLRELLVHMIESTPATTATQTCCGSGLTGASVNRAASRSRSVD